MKKTIFTLILLLLLPLVWSFADTSLKFTTIQIPGGSEGIGLDDIGFSQALHKMLVPSGRTGKLNLIDPDTHEIISISGFSSGQEQQGERSHEGGTTSADEGRGLIFAADRTKKIVAIVDPVAKKIITSTLLAGGSDYVRYVQITNEVWVTDPHSQQIEVFSLSTTDKPTLTHSLFISVPGGPESLVIDNSRERAYTNLWSDTTIAIDIKTHAIVAKWSNSCEGSRGIALDEKRGFLFVGGKEGKAVVLDLKQDGKLVSSLQSGSGVDIISYNPALAHLYLPGGSSATMAILGVSDKGQLSLLGIGNTSKGSRCAVSDDRNNIWVSDPDHGRLLLFKDPFPKTS